MYEEPVKQISSKVIRNDMAPAKFKKAQILLACFVIFSILCASLYLWILQINLPPDNFPNNLPITIEQGSDVKTITVQLEERNVVKSSSLLYYILAIFHDPTAIKASTYIFEKPMTSIEIAERLTKGDFDSDLIRFTHYEGERVSQIADRAATILPRFDKNIFISLAEPNEGRLFPETYFISQSYTEKELLELMINTFNDKMEHFSQQIQNHSLALDEILILASIIEREANSLESKKMVSGILQNRMLIGMPLQADASIEYALDKPLSKLTPADLEIDSPYNTYLNLGLPPTPIGNPGIDSIVSVLEPSDSEYLFYITGDDGEFYYAKTYEQHLRNINLHLR